MNNSRDPLISKSRIGDLSRSTIWTNYHLIAGLFCVVLLVGLLLSTTANLVKGMSTETNSADAGPKILLELFTSQGCSSCPKADILLPKFIARKDVIVISLSIDYWDYLGWQDTFGQTIFTSRQRSYGKKIGSGYVYTPQMVVDGRFHVNGGDQKGIEALIKQRQKEKTSPSGVTLVVKAMDDVLQVSVQAKSKDVSAQKGTLWMALVSKSETVKIRRGENRGRYLTYHNIVRELTPIGQWTGGQLTVKLPRNTIMQRGADGCVVFLQRGDGGPIIAAAQMARW